MFPILILVYRRLTIREEVEVRAHLGEAWERYAAKTPRFVPRLHGPARTSAPAVDPDP
jgi:protein-S-isoprenylcysteine O-methyltransferase Ste14